MSNRYTNRPNSMIGRSQSNLKRVSTTKVVRKVRASEAVPAEEKEAMNSSLERPSSVSSLLRGNRPLVKPKDQETLNTEQLSEEITKILKADNPDAPQNIARFNFKLRSFQFDATVDQVATHYVHNGNLIHRESEMGKRQLAAEEAEEREAERTTTSTGVGTSTEGDEGITELAEAGTGTGGIAGGKKLRNEFNFSERASQTLNQGRRDRAVLTEPPPKVDFSATATQWEIYDTYMEDLEKQKAVKEKGRGAGGLRGGKGSGKSTEVEATAKKTDADVIHSVAMLRSAKILERMVNQNTFDEIAQDFKYWEDESDTFKEGEGSLLPLWKFNVDKGKRRTITSICWNSEYPDLFAVGYGSYDFLKPTTGLLACFSLKNPTHPEYKFPTEHGVMCLDFHPHHSSLLVAGMYEGTVAVFDLASSSFKPLFQSTSVAGKHTDPVWQVRWQEEDLAKNLNFFSISSDGRVTSWTLVKNELQHLDVMELKFTSSPSSLGAAGIEAPSVGAPGGDDDPAMFGLAGGVSFDFNPFSEHLFVVGTEEGAIHKCSKAYSSQYLETYEGHAMAVYAVVWNKFHPRVFLSGSADWTVKVWDQSRREPVMSFDLGDPVADVAWAPYSSTVFAAVTTNGFVNVYDVAVNRHEPVCSQQVVRKANLTHVAFNPKEPVLLVSDDKGFVSCLKLSPNLRHTVAKDQAEQEKDLLTGIGATTRVRRGGEANGEDGEHREDDAKTPEDLEREKLENVLGINK